VSALFFSDVPLQHSFTLRHLLFSCRTCDSELRLAAGRAYSSPCHCGNESELCNRPLEDAGLRFCVICRDTEESNSKGVFPIQDILSSHQLVFFSIASRAVLTHQTALALVAHVLPSGGSTTRAPEASRKAASLSNTLRFLHLFGMPFVILACMLHREGTSTGMLCFIVMQVQYVYSLGSCTFCYRDTSRIGNLISIVGLRRPSAI